MEPIPRRVGAVLPGVGLPARLQPWIRRCRAVNHLLWLKLVRGCVLSTGNCDGASVATPLLSTCAGRALTAGGVSGGLALCGVRCFVEPHTTKHSLLLEYYIQSPILKRTCCALLMARGDTRPP